jgi:hypothetical protein
MPGTIFPHNNIIATGQDTFVGSKVGITIPGLPKKISFVGATFQSVSTAGQVANNADVQVVIAADGKSFSLYTFTQAGAASTTSAVVNWFAIIE